MKVYTWPVHSIVGIFHWLWWWALSSSQAKETHLDWGFSSLTANISLGDSGPIRRTSWSCEKWTRVWRCKLSCEDVRMGVSLEQTWTQACLSMSQAWGHGKGQLTGDSSLSFPTYRQHLHPDAGKPNPSHRGCQEHCRAPLEGGTSEKTKVRYH